MIINIYTPSIARDIFSGGIYCIFRHANELIQQGHTVNIIPALGSRKPEWIETQAKIHLAPKESFLKRKLFKTRVDLNNPVQKAKSDQFQLVSAPKADIHVATHWSTAYLVAQIKEGHKAYFVQHFEPVFEPTESYDWHCAFNSYLLPLYKITNSSWAAEVLNTFLTARGLPQPLLRGINGIDGTIYHPSSTPASTSDAATIKIISYGGRNVEWKGFIEMAQAIALARKKLPAIHIDWRVFGSAALPPENNIANFTSLGFLNPNELAEQYRSSDILLSASWYESFPLFPIEAMACGIAAITTRKGTEDYAIHRQNCLIVKEKNIEEICNTIIELIDDLALRNALKSKAISVIDDFSWSRAGVKMSQNLKAILNLPIVPSPSYGEFFREL